MIIAAGLLVLTGLGLFVAGVLTGVTALFWACVGVCVVAAVLLFLARRQLRTTAPAAAPSPAATRPASVPEATATGATSTTAAAAPVTAVPAAPAPVDAAPETSTGRHGGSADAPRTVAPEPAAAGNGAAPHEETAPPTTPAHAHAHASEPSRAPGEAGEPPVEEVEVTDLLLVVDLRDEVLVVDEHPRYHVAGCRYLAGQETIPLPVDEAKTDGFTPCGSCRPDAALADRVRAQRAPGS